MIRRLRIHVTGIVQGVGMRPFVYREAVSLHLTGWVRNGGDGVHAEVQGTDDAVHRLIHVLRERRPVAARIDRILVEEIPPSEGEELFRILESDGATERTTLVSPDIATCPDCLRELFDPADRRFHYPFINCTNCGPRYTIIRALPYDRARTSMDPFPMCPACAAEYADPLDRRFHAQPDACFTCGPHLTWRERARSAGAAADGTPLVGSTRELSDALIARCAELLATGRIVALKGLGGFHLACDATDEPAVRELRRRKRRSDKPLAIMVPDLEAARRICHVGPEEAELLAGPVRPIVLLRRRPGADGPAPSVAFGLPEIGVMLPYTPLHHLLFDALSGKGISMLVMTSGNVSEEPIETDDAQAWRRLVEGGLADAMLGNDRAILARFDDSVARVTDGRARPVRRARGYAPRPLPLPPLAGSSPPPPGILACGSEQKATLAFTREGSQGDGAAECLLSQHIGDIENAGTLEAWHGTRLHMQELFGTSARAIACDAHPSYLSSQWARAESERTGRPLIEVQHHHAHIASVLAEALSTPVPSFGGDRTTGVHTGAADPAARPVLGIALDGTGAGTDGTIWGGELLTATLGHFKRVGHLAPWPLPGGPAAVRDAAQNAFGLLSALDLLDHPGALPLRRSLDHRVEPLAAMVERRVNTPLTSSMGRLLDACAALVGIGPRATYEGEPAILLESAAWRGIDRMRREGAGLPQDDDGALRELACREARYRMGLAEQVVPPASALIVRNRERVGEIPAERNLVIDPLPMLEAVLDDVARGRDAEGIALDIHLAVARAVAEAACSIARRGSLDAAALSGGVFLNRILSNLVPQLLRGRGLTVLMAAAVPVNDGCIAYGQAAVARARLTGAR